MSEETLFQQLVSSEETLSLLSFSVHLCSYFRLNVTKIFCKNIEMQKQKGGGIDFRGKDLFDPLGKCVQRHLREWPRENIQHTHNIRKTQDRKRESTQHRHKH